MKLERVEEAEPLARAALESERRVEGPDSPSSHNTQRTLISALVGLGRPEHLDEVEALARDTYQAAKAARGPDHLMTSQLALELGACEVALKRVTGFDRARR